MLEKIIPHIPSNNLEETVSFMSQVLGFSVVPQSDFYVELHSKGKVLGVLASEGEPNQ